MKIRKGFVSNSSSSSFICDVCGQDASGWDMSLSEAEMYECENGHIFCEEHAINMVSKKEMALNLITSLLEDAKSDGASEWSVKSVPEYEQLIEYINSDNDCDYDGILSDYEFRYSMPAAHCPICQMDVVTDSDMAAYLSKSKNLTKDVVKTEIKGKFNDYKSLANYLNEEED